MLDEAVNNEKNDREMRVLDIAEVLRAATGPQAMPKELSGANKE
jgi:hypothetical protein